MALANLLLFLFLVFVIMIVLFPKILYLITGLFYLIKGSPKPKRTGKNIEFSLKDFKEVKEQKIVLK